MRQGLKSRAFVGTFMGLQALMVFSVIMYILILRDNPGDLTFANGLFWFLLGILLVLVMPFRAFQALHDEQKNNTLEMLFLTRMTSWKIAFGKWLALVVQLLLMVSAVLPYLVMRYFLGTINIAEDLVTLSMLVWVAMMLIAAGVGFSGWKSKLLRGLMIAGAVFSLYMLPMLLFGFSRAMGTRMFSHPSLWIIGVITTFLLMLFLVEYGASLIAPPAENHARRKRGLALVIIGFYATSVWLQGTMELIMLGLLFIVPICIDALCEPAHMVPSLYRGVSKLNLFRRIWRRLTYPGWPSGFLFVMLLMGGWTLAALNSTASVPRLDVFLISLVGALIFPLALILLIKPTITDFMPQYLIIQLILFITSLVLLVVGYMVHSVFDAFAQFVPITACIGAIADEAQPEWFWSILVVTLVCMGIIGSRAMKPWRRMLALEQAD